MQYGRQQTRQVTGRQKRNGVIDIRGKVAILRIVRHAFAQQVTRFFQQRTGGQSFAHIQPLRRRQPLNGQHPAGVLGHRPQAATGSRRHGNMVFLVRGGGQAVNAMRVRQRFVFTG